MYPEGRVAINGGCRALGFRGLEFRVWGLGFRVWGFGFRVWGLGFGVLGFRGGVGWVLPRTCNSLY